jgi:hypothetical protein
VVSLELVVLLVCANPTAALPNRTAIPKDKAAVLNEFFTMTSPLVPMMIGSFQSKVVFSSTARTSEVLNAGLSAPENAIGRVVCWLRPIQSCRLIRAADRLASRAHSSSSFRKLVSVPQVTSVSLVPAKRVSLSIIRMVQN